MGNDVEREGPRSGEHRADVLAHHLTREGTRQPTELHPARELPGRRPGLAAVTGLRVTGKKRARISAGGNGIIIVGHRNVGGAARSFRVNAHTLDEVVHTAADRVGGDAGDGTPIDSVDGSAEHDVIRAAAAFKAAIGPGNVHRAAAVNGCGRQPKVAQSTIRTTAGSAGNAYRRLPALAAIGGGER